MKPRLSDHLCCNVDGFNSSANRHRPLSRARVEHRDPLEILEELRGIETEILGEIDGLAEAAPEASSE